MRVLLSAVVDACMMSKSSNSVFISQQLYMNKNDMLYKMKEEEEEEEEEEEAEEEEAAKKVFSFRLHSFHPFTISCTHLIEIVVFLSNVI